MYRAIKLLLIVGLTSISTVWATTYFGPTPITRTLAQFVAQPVKISDLVREPAKYDGSLIQVSGRLNPNTKVAALGLGCFGVEDEAGNKIIVLVRNGIPVGDASGTVKVAGIYKMLFEIGPYSYPVLLAG